MESCVAINQEEIILQLRLKVNKLIDKVEEQNNELKTKDDKLKEQEKAINVLKKHCLILKGKISAEQTSENELIMLIRSFSDVVSKLFQDNAFIQYKNFTKNSAKYFKVEKSVFDVCLAEKVNTERREFFEKCVEFGFFKAIDGKYTFNDNQIRIYFISKSVINLICGEVNA